jgi:hypothetical protein
MATRVLVLCALLLSASTAFADTLVFSTFLSGSAESPPNPSPGTGSAFVSFDTVTHMMFVSATFSGLLGPTSAAHIHCCTLPTAGVATQTPSFMGFPLGVTTGSFSNTFDMTLASSYNAAFITANGGTVASAEAALIGGMVAGAAYFNIHTSVFPGGEIRGFLAVPEPSVLVFVGVGLLVLCLGYKRVAALAVR